MSKKLLYALLLMGVTVIVLIFNRGRVDVNLILGEVSFLKSLVFLAFTGVGVTIGVLLK